MYLNLGCGSWMWDGWLNVDCVPCKSKDGKRKLDVIADSLHLPFKTGSLKGVAMIHVIEHMYLEEVPALLDELKRVLKKGGELIIEGPDIKKCYELFKDDLQRLGPNLYGDAKPGVIADLHKFGWSGEAVLWALNKMGFKARVSPAICHHQPERDYRVIGVKVS
jgi:predicted SAM-dependent methyltransferase